MFWFEQGEGGKWTRRQIDGAWSQAHASTLVDLNGDGQPDFVTGKRFMAHNGNDPGEREPLGVYWFEHRPGAPSAPGNAPGIEWIRHIIDFGGRMGGGMQIPVVDIDGDGDLDVDLRRQERAVSGGERHEGAAKWVGIRDSGLGIGGRRSGARVQELEQELRCTLISAL